MILKYAIGWCGLLVVAMVNGMMREFLYKPHVGDLPAHQISVVTGIALFGLVIWYFVKLWPFTASHQAWTVGFMWLAMTIAFEFLFFHYARSVPWDVLLQDYNIFAGRLWILVLIWVTLAPWLIWRWSKKQRNPVMS